MARIARIKIGWDTTIKRLAGILSCGAAAVSIMSFILGRQSAAAHAAAAVEVDRLELLPRADTAFALGDTLRLTAMAADVRGIAVLPSRIAWQSEDSAVAVVDSAGHVLARGPGHAVVTVAAGGRMARARVSVLPRVVRLEFMADSVLDLAEGESRPLQVEAKDARANLVAAAGLQWSVSDRTIAVIDSAGELRAVAPGSTSVAARLGELLVQRPVVVRAVPGSLTLLAGGAQRAPAGDRLPAPIAIQVVSRSGRPVPGASVRFEAGGGGELAVDTSRADSAGVARLKWRLGARPGRQVALVTVPGVDSPLVVSAEAEPVAASTRIVLSPESLDGRVLGPLERPIVVEVRDTSGLPLGDVPVAWKPLDGGEVLALSARTDSLGVAEARWTLGPKAGRQRLQVQVGSARYVPPRVVTAEARPGEPVRLTLQGGDGQRGRVGKTLARDVILKVTDSLGNPVGDAPVKLHRGRSAGDTVLRSAQDGRVRYRWTLATRAGPDTLQAELEGGGKVRVAAVAEPGPADSLGFVGGPASAMAGKPLPKALEVRAADRFGNPVPGAAITLSASGGRLSASRVVTDARGLASVRWTPGSGAGRQVVSASLNGSTLKARHPVQVSAAPAVRASKPASRPSTPAPAPAPAPARARSPFGT